MSPSHQINSVAIIGAGLAGISCAVALRKSIDAVTVFEQESQPGGRIISRRHDVCQFDSGAQYFTARSEAFRSQVEEWREQWLVDDWQAWLVDLQNGEALSHEDGVTRFIGRPAMNSFVEDMAELCDVRYDTQIKKIRRIKKEARWQLVDTRGGKYGAFDAVLLAVPAPPAATMLSVAPGLAKVAAQVKMTAAWTLMAVFDQPLQMGFDGAYVVSEELSWIVRDSGKVERGDVDGREVWVIHASPEWSEKNAKLSEKKVVRILLDAFARVTGHRLPAAVVTATEFWRYARPVNPLSSGCLYDTELRIGACGDWCYAAKVEGAYISGVTMAARVLQNAGTEQ